MVTENGGSGKPSCFTLSNACQALPGTISGNNRQPETAAKGICHDRHALPTETLPPCWPARLICIRKNSSSLCHRPLNHGIEPGTCGLIGFPMIASYSTRPSSYHPVPPPLRTHYADQAIRRKSRRPLGELKRLWRLKGRTISTIACSPNWLTRLAAHRQTAPPKKKGRNKSIAGICQSIDDTRSGQGFPAIPGIVQTETTTSQDQIARPMP